MIAETLRLVPKFLTYNHELNLFLFEYNLSSKDSDCRLSINYAAIFQRLQISFLTDFFEIIIFFKSQ